MIDDTEFSELVLYYDTREQSNVVGRPRVKRIIDWFNQRGGTMIEEMALPLCDYAICGGYDENTKTFSPGIFRDKKICLGIEYKGLIDIGNNIDDLDWKLIEAYKYFTQVSLFVEEGNISLSYVDGKTYIKNSGAFTKKIESGKNKVELADILIYEHYKNEIDRFSQIADVHVRTFSHEAFIDANLDSLMILISEKPDVRLYCRGTDADKEKSAFITSLLGIPKIGVSTAMKIAEVYPNLEQFVNHLHYEGEYEKIAGDVTGKKIRKILTDNSRLETCQENYQKLFVCSEINKLQSLKATEPGLNYTHRKLENPIKPAGEVIEGGTTCLHDTLQSSSANNSTPDPAGTNFKSIPSTTPSPAGNSHQSSKIPSTQPSGSLSSDQDVGDQQPSLCDVGENAAVSVPVAIPGHSNIKVIESLHDAIVDFCYKEPKSDTEIIAAFQYKGYNLIEIHKAMNELSKTKLHKYQDKGVTTYTYKGVKADVDMNVGV